MKTNGDNTFTSKSMGSVISHGVCSFQNRLAPIFIYHLRVVVLACVIILQIMMTTQDNNSNFLSAFINAHAKPIFKEALKEFLIENNLSLVSTVAPNPSKLLSTAQVAEMCGVNRHRIYEMIDEGLPYIEEKPFKFRLDDVNNFIAQNVKYRKKAK